MASNTVSSFTQTTQIQTAKIVDTQQTKTITNELLDQFLDSHSEISMDLMEELKSFEEFLNNENDFLDNRLSCGEVILNKHGILIYKCNLCKSTGQEFVNISNYDEHLRLYHPTSQKLSTLQQHQAQNNDIYPFAELAKNDLWVEDLFKIEKLNKDSRSMEFLEHLDKVPRLDELDVDDGHHRKNILQNKADHVTNTDTTTNKDINNNNNEHISKVATHTLPSLEQYEQTKKRKKRTPGYCEICKRRFNDLYNLRVHMMIHTGEKPYQCEDCGKKFRQYNKLKIHRVTHTNKRPFMCDICGKGFRFRNYLSVHKRLHSGEKPYKCKFCDEYFHSLHTRRLHMKIQHAATEIYTCSECGKILTSQCYLTAHMKRHNNQRDFECNVCAKRFFSLSQLKDHQLSHTNIKPFQCHICQAKFQRKSNFNQHLKIHSNVKSYVCNICHKAFAQNAGLYGHMKSHAKS